MVGPVCFCFGRDGCLSALASFSVVFIGQLYTLRSNSVPLLIIPSPISHLPSPISFALPLLSPLRSAPPCSSHAMFLLALVFRPFLSCSGELFRVNNFCFIFAPGNFTPGVVRIMVRTSVVSRFSNPLLFVCSFLFRQKAAQKPLLPIVFACCGGPNAASGACSRVCKQTCPCADAFSSSSAYGSDIGAEFLQRKETPTQKIESIGTRDE